MTDIALQVHQTRSEGTIGASDAACALGFDPYRSPLTLWRQLRGLHVDDDKPEAVREAAEWGQALEPVVRGKYALKTSSRVVVPSHSFVMNGWLSCTPDGFVLPGHELGAGVIEMPPQLGILNASAYDGLYEGKTCSAYLRDDWEEGVPAKHELQARVQMAVTGLPWVDVCCLVGGQRFVGPIRITRDQTLEDRILTDLQAFWSLVKNGIEPSVDGTAAWREHVSERMAAIKSKVVIAASGELAKDIEAWKQARRAKAISTAAEAEIKNRILLAMSAAGATGVMVDPDTKISAYRVGGRTDYKAAYIDATGFKDAPDRFKTKSLTWTIRAPWGAEDE